MHKYFAPGQFWPSGIVVACVCLCVYQSLACPRDKLGPVQARITKFGPNMQKTLVKVPIVLGGNWPSRSNFTWKSEFTPFWVCPHHNSLPIQARITKFGPEVQNSLVKIPIALGGNWPWPSRSNLTLDCFTGLTVSWSPSSVHTYIPRLFHGPDCFSLNTLHIYWSRQPRVFRHLPSLL